MITIEKIKIEGFGSAIYQIKYKFNRPGLNIIVGVNGAGKTTIFNALTWVLYKQLIKKGSTYQPWPWVIKNHPDYKGTKVSLEFNDGINQYEIIRCDEYKGKILGKTGKNRLVILKNGEELVGDGLRNKDDYQKWIIKTIGYSFELFKSSVLFGQKLKRLAEEDGPTKKRIFDEAFETTFIDKAQEIVKKRLQGDINQLNKLSTSRSIMDIQINNVEEGIKREKEILANFESNRQSEYERTQDEINLLRKKLKGRKAHLSDLSKLKENLENKKKDINPKISDTAFKLEMELLGLKASRETLINELNTHHYELSKSTLTCTKCGQELERKKLENLKKEIRLKIPDLKKQCRELGDKIKGVDKKILNNKSDIDNQERIKKEIETYKDLISNLEKKSAIYDSVRDKISWHKKELVRIENQKPPENNLGDLQKKEVELKAKLGELKLEIKGIDKKIDIDNWLLKEPLSNSGLKAFIFDSMISRLNNQLKNYTSLVGFEIKVGIDLKSSRKDILISVIKNKDEVPSEDLSGGEKQLVDISIAFALNDVVNKLRPINIFLPDEAFESLSEENLEAVGNIIIKKSHNRCIHLVTHQKAFNPINTYKTYLEKDSLGKTVIHTKFKEA